jgi:hypothetical protein
MNNKTAKRIRKLHGLTNFNKTTEEDYDYTESSKIVGVDPLTSEPIIARTSVATLKTTSQRKKYKNLKKLYKAA